MELINEMLTLGPSVALLGYTALARLQQVQGNHVQPSRPWTLWLTSPSSVTTQPSGGLKEMLCGRNLS